MKKWIAFAVIVVLLGGLYLVDFIRAKNYEFEFISSSTDVFVADGGSPVRLRFRLVRGGEPVEGHTITIVASNGTLPASRVVTDEDGEIEFRYYTYLYLDDRLTPLEDVVFRLEDESNSLIFMVPVAAEFSFPVEKPEGDTVWEDWEDIVLEDTI